MPRVHNGNKERKEQQAIDDLCKEIMRHINAKRGIEDKTKSEFAEFLGITPNCLLRWNKGAARNAQFASLVTAAMRCGIKIRVEV